MVSYYMLTQLKQNIKVTYISFIGTLHGQLAISQLCLNCHSYEHKFFRTI